MARPLVVRWNGAEVPLQLDKVERADLYGYTEVEAFDDDRRPCHLATLAQDGRTLIGSGGSAIAYLSTDGEWLEKEELTPVDLDGRPMTPVPSSFSAPVDLGDRVSIENLLDHTIRAVYLLHAVEGEAGWDALHQELKDGTIFQFPFSYRGGLNPDAAFLLQGQDGNLFMLVGSPTQIEFVGFNEVAAVVEDAPEAAEEDDGLDFSMF